MPDPARRPLYYTFGNHMHWVDMQWLWGYHVLPGSVRDMLRLIEETGARGNVNFDAIGYEKMAAECPEALAALREAIAAGKVEPVGCSYGQPYGLFHGGESNVRQLTYGVRTTRRLLGVRPRAFWEEEFYFFPQLPQMLAQCGYTGACLFFQWTWHTPEVPKEACSLILWEGIDGTRLPTLPRNELNVHQWPEDFDGLLERAAEQQSSGAAHAEHGGVPAIVQWLELMPSRDWMCRSEVLLPRLKELMADPRFEVRPRVASELIAELHEGARAAERSSGAPIPVRAYTMDDVWHGMSLGKNADNHPRESSLVESTILGAEAMSALAGLFGRPYASWDLYPTWELEESWRDLLSAQHHDNHECEGLCGFVADESFQRAENLSRGVLSRTVRGLASRIDAPGPGFVLFNPGGVTRDMLFTAEGDTPVTAAVVRGVPPFGYAVIDPGVPRLERISAAHKPGWVTFSRGPLSVTVDKRRGLVTQITTREFPEGLLHPERPLGRFWMTRDGREDRFDHADVRIGDVGGQPVIHITRQGRDERQIAMEVRLEALEDAVDIVLMADDLPRPDRGMNAGLMFPIAPAFAVSAVVAEHPYGQSPVTGAVSGRRKYPTGDWMTSPQVIEDVRRPMTALSWFDVAAADGRGVIFLHDGSQQLFRDDDGVRVLLSMYDPWDEDHFKPQLRARLQILPRGPMTPGDRAAAVARHRGNWSICGRDAAQGDIPARFGALSVEGAPGVIAQAFFRESMKSGEHLPDWAGHRMFKESNGACDHPYVIRLVEWDGEPAEVVLKLPGRVAMAAKTNLLGEVRDGETRHGGNAPRRGDGEAGGWSWVDTAWLTPEHPVEPPLWAKGAKLKGEAITWSAVRFRMRPREIATIYADLVMGRKQWRDLDAKREVWATVHRT